MYSAYYAIGADSWQDFTFCGALPRENGQKLPFFCFYRECDLGLDFELSSRVGRCRAATQQLLPVTALLLSSYRQCQELCPSSSLSALHAVFLVMMMHLAAALLTLVTLGDGSHVGVGAGLHRIPFHLQICVQNTKCPVRTLL